MVKKGNILISEPFLEDANFERTIILICENNDNGSFGFVLNKPTFLTLDSVLNGVKDFAEILYLGGPVSRDTLHFIYRNKAALEDSVEIMDNLYWGGNFDHLVEKINSRQVDPADFRFFLGYSGWGQGQLNEELEKNSWIVGSATCDDLFDTNPNELWRSVLKNMGGKYKMFSNYPIDPRLN